MRPTVLSLRELTIALKDLKKYVKEVHRISEEAMFDTRILAEKVTVLDRKFTGDLHPNHAQEPKVSRFGDYTMAAHNSYEWHPPGDDD